MKSSKGGQNELHIARFSRNKALEELLMKKGANTDIESIVNEKIEEHNAIL
jgi:hypothetical protein